MREAAMTSIALKKHLLGVYGGFADKRIKKAESGKTFCIDDRTEGDHGAGGHLLSYSCTMFAKVRDDGRVEVILDRNSPTSPAVVNTANSIGAAIFTMEPHTRITVVIAVNEAQKLRALASAIRTITAPGKRYGVPSYKYVVPRTADSLERFADALDGYVKARL
jgi:hypothetical protein